MENIESNIKIIADSVEKLMKTDRPELVNLIPEAWIGYPVGTLGAFPSQGLYIMCRGIYPFPITHLDGANLDYNIEYIGLQGAGLFRISRHYRRLLMRL